MSKKNINFNFLIQCSVVYITIDNIQIINDPKYFYFDVIIVTNSKNKTENIFINYNFNYSSNQIIPS